MARPEDVAGPGVFSRPASGLIRVAGSTDVFYNVGVVPVGIAIALNQDYGPSLYQGAGVLLATGTRRYFSVQKVLFAVALLGTAVLVAVLLAGILTGNVLLAVIIMATFVAWIWFWIPAELAYTTRTMIAWSFDRLAPDRLGFVGARVHTPVVAIGLSTAGSVVFMWLIAHRSIALLSLIGALLVAWGVAMAAAAVFPWRRPEFYEASPGRP